MKNHDFLIRPYDGRTDTRQLSRIWLDASLLAHSFIGEQRLKEQRALIEDQYLPNAETWVASIGEKPAGFISLIGTFIGGLFVSPRWQRFGIGRRLIAHALNLKGELSLEVYTQNQQAMRFYTGMGFQELSRREVDDEGSPFENARLRLIG
ncbi:GNAT family N-acetyltransferase [Consotaella salsifontis]|uniref:Acetyltransferase (GNAT) domain-containing protein n=1 Tax=Consotaella salsifontis TaxID=1365950 RepID=A0A1T4RRU8_9HYPH|nr:GNAT family N-acetyltransferase [Consotaella salsifontis]SKA18607.1 Acetyltransferase (GNAT) domain-containing protein [Consotaella salsifontis]